MRKFMKPAPLPMGEPPLSLDVHANVLSQTLFSWVWPILKVGYSRPLEQEDLYRLDEPRLAKTVADSLEVNFYARTIDERRPRFLQDRNLSVEGVRSADDSRATSRGESSSETDGGDEKKAHLPGGKEGGQAESGLPLPVSARRNSNSTSPASTLAPTSSNNHHDPSSSSTSSRAKDKSRKKTAIEEEKFKKKYPGNAEGGKVWDEREGKAYDQSLAWALSKTFFWPFWSSAIFLIISSGLQTTSPLVTKELLKFITTAYTAARTPGVEVPPIGRGIGIAFGLFAMQQVASLCSNQYMQRGMTTGFLMRTACISLISRKALRLSGAARVKHPNGHLITLVSSDASFLDWSAFLLHVVWTQPIIILVGIGLLCGNLGYSALVGVAILALNTPVQTFFVQRMFRTRQTQLKIVDQRVRLLQEVLNGIRVVKLYAYEAFFKTKIASLRNEELEKLRTIAATRAGMSATMSFVPVLAAVLSFITYSLSGHELDAATIFSSLQLFNVIRQPLVMLPMALTVTSDAYAALKRIATLLLAEDLASARIIDPSLEHAISAHGDFTWEASQEGGGIMGGKGGGGQGRGGKDYEAIRKKKAEEKRRKKEEKERKKKGLPKVEKGEGEGEKGEEKEPFGLRDIDLDVKRGDLVCIVGEVGSGKSSLLQALIGEMKKLKGEVIFGGSTAYVSQIPWVQNATLRENILFGKPSEPERFERVIKACALESDIDVLAYGLETEIGEKGINLSGGQKARVCLARAVYFDADIVMLDDPISAVDAHVAKTLVDDCITGNGPLASKTRILVTHHLDVLPLADHIVVMEGGRISEQGSYASLLSSGAAFSRLIAEFGSANNHKASASSSSSSSEAGEDAIIEDVVAGGKEAKEMEEVGKETEKTVPGTKYGEKGAEGAKLMQSEERETGSVSSKVYTHYFQSMGSVLWAPALLSIYALAQIATVGNNIFLGFWSAQSISSFNSEGPYMAIYASFGLAAGIFTFIGTFLMYLRGISASYHLFNEALSGVLRSKIAWFDTTPTGRITSRLSKDITTLDNQLPMQWNQLLTLVFNVFGTIGLVFYTYPLLGIIFVPMAILYYGFATFYRQSSREIKRIDSVLRSHIYSSFGEMLTGLASVRAYGSQALFMDRTETAVDVENRAYFLSIVLQRWLGVRLDFLGNLLVLGIGLFGVGFRTTVDPSKLGVVLTYSLSVAQVFSQLVTNFATVEQDMNTAERVSHYAHLEPEAPTTLDDDPEPSWPSQGVIEFRDVRLRYREGLPEVLKGISFSTRPGEKVGVIGRTGAGKSSLLQALFRIVEPSGGQIIIDGRDTATIGLDALRKRIAVIPQDPLLYAGTVRQNLDPTEEHDDASLNDALQRAGLFRAEDGTMDQSRFDKFKLDAQVNDEGSNFSAGERQLVALARALVKSSRITCLDEATSSVDSATDATIQRTIMAEFGKQTLLCIAHRLATIAFYDRILVLDQGTVAEYDEPLVLFDRPESIFRGMCDKAGLNRKDIVKLRKLAGKHDDDGGDDVDSDGDLGRAEAKEAFVLGDD